MTKYLFVPVIGPMEIREGKLDGPEGAEYLSSQVGGYLEAVEGRVGEDNWHAYVDDEGKLKGRLVNERADAIARDLGWQHVSLFGPDYLVGDAVFLSADATGDEADVPPFVIDAARRYGVVEGG